MTFVLTVVAWVSSYAWPTGTDLFGNGYRALMSVCLSDGVVGIGRRAGATGEPAWPHLIDEAKAVQPTIWNRMGFGARAFATNQASGWAATAPLPLFVLLASVLPVLWLRAVRGERRRRDLLRSGCCPECGYDLCSHEHRCPECGWEFVRVGYQRYVGAGTDGGSAQTRR